MMTHNGRFLIVGLIGVGKIALFQRIPLFGSQDLDVLSRNHMNVTRDGRFTIPLPIPPSLAARPSVWRVCGSTLLSNVFGVFSP